ncbi:YwiC-like family protein [Bacillus sp. CLL-7-23]|uniref:YwiC-like family protein n=1 Tax=Bacillus changyiensis TaxID=3004103 RepID=A0ABT4X6L1_9BACI|nr:YwiC-like family protein [Bacillus changyiensis]MDA7027934.1 YwiC-like family protein [Bacillus changyiensis]
MKIFIPKQHGAWAMLVIPFFLGMVGGGADVKHIPLFLGWLFLYLATFPVMMLVKKKNIAYYRKWVAIYGMISILFLLIVVWAVPMLILFGFSLVPFFLVNLFYAKKNHDRAFVNDIVAIIVFSVGGLASYWVGEGRLDGWAWFIFIQSILFFMGSAFYVKSMIREKNNKQFKYCSWGYHLILPFLAVMLGAGWAVFGFIPSSLRAWFFYGKKLSIMKIGIYELVNSSIFLIVMSIFLISM